MLNKHLKEISKFYLIPMIIAIFIAIPLVLSRSDYQDDMYRTTSGYTDFWFENARPLSVWIYRIINQNYVTPDTTPLNFIISITILLVSSLFLSKKISDKKEIRICSSILFMSTPFLTSILSYKYDCLTVSIAIFLAVFFNILELSNKIILFIIRVVTVFSIFCIYQPVIALAFGIVGLMITSGTDEIKKHITSALTKTLSIFIGFVIYKKTISDIYLSEHYKNLGKIISIDNNTLSKIFFNITGYSKLIYNFISEPYIMVPLIISSIYALRNVIILRGSNGFVRFTIAAPFIFTSAIGCNIILQNPSFQAREMLGFPCLMIFITLLSWNKKERAKTSYIIYTLTLGVLITNTMISYTYLNFKDEMFRRDTYITNDIKSAINHYGIENVKSIELVYSKTPYTDKQYNMAKAYPSIMDMIFNNGFANLWYAQGYLSSINNIKIPMREVRTDIETPDFKTCSSDSTIKDKIMKISIKNNCL